MKTIYSFWLFVLFFSLSINLNAQNMALDFGASNDYVTTASTSTLNMSGTSFTIELWVQSSATFANQVAFLAYRTTVWGAGAYQIGGTDSYIKFSINNVVSLSANIAWADGTWHHIAATYDNSTHNTRIYFDGIDVANGTSSNAIGSTTQPLYLGDYDGSANANIQMDEIRIWKEVRSESEIRANMLSQLAGTETYLALYYKCNATSGTTLTDATANGIDGTLYNMSDDDWIPSPAFYGPKNCLSFDGTDDYAINTGISGATGANSFTMEALVYRDPNTATDDFLLVGNSYTGSNARVMLGYNSTSSSLVSYYKGTDAGAAETVDTEHELAKGKWYHVAIVYNNTTLRFYVDGEDVYYKTGLSLTFALNSASNMYIAGPSEYGQLKMDEVRLWSDVRTATEIKDNMYKELVGNEAGLLAYYKMNFNNGTTIPNYSSQGTANDATLTNMDAATDWVKSEAYNNWLNTNSTTWGTAGNWATGSVPNTSTNVIIADLSSDPTITSDIDIHSFIVESGVSLSTIHSVDISGFADLNADLTIISGEYMEVGADLSIGSGNTLTINAGATVTGDALNNSGTLTIESDATGTGSLIVTSATGTGTVNVERYIPSINWHIVSSPVVGQLFSAFGLVNGLSTQGSDYALASYDEPNNKWAFVATTESFSSGIGYEIMAGTAKTVTFSGTGIFTGDVDANITQSGASYGWNAVGNPYTSAIRTKGATSPDEDILGKNDSNFDPSFKALYIWNQTDYVTISNGGDFDFASGNLDQSKISVGQGFIVKSVSGGATFNFTEKMQIHDATATPLKSAEISTSAIRLTVMSGDLINRTIVSFDKESTKGLDPGYDVGKLKGNANIALFTQLVDGSSDVDFMCQSVPDVNYELLTILVGLDLKNAGNVTFSLETTNGFPSDMKVYLEDKALNITTQLDKKDAIYSVSVPTLKGYGRFNLHFTNSTTEIDTDQLNIPDFNVFTRDRLIFINGQADKDTRFSVYGIDGKIWYQNRAESTNQNTIDASGFAAGVYLIKIDKTSGSQTLRVVLIN